MNTIKEIMNTIEINNTGIKIDVSVFLFKEDDVFHAYCSELDLVGYDYTEEGAKKSFEWVLKDYLEYTVENGTLEQDLLSHGWRKSKSGNSQFLIQSWKDKERFF